MDKTKEIKEHRCYLSDVCLEKREDGQTGRTISGYAAKFNTWSCPLGGWFREKISPTAFDDCDMSDVIATFNHNENDLLGRTNSGTLQLSVDEIGLRFSFEAPGTTLGNDIVELVRRRDIGQCSFIMFVSEDEWIHADGENGLELSQRTVTKISKLYDIALVVRAAYKQTEVSVRKLEQAIADRGKQPDETSADTVAQREMDFQFITVRNNE